jgi:tRNA 2-thiouridine synthesizing protein B
MILHTLSATPYSVAFSECLAIAKPGDAILLLGDGVYGARPGERVAAALTACGADIHLLETDAQAAGIETLPEEMQIEDMDGFVALTERFARQMAWY